MTKGLDLWNIFAANVLQELREMSPDDRREFWGWPSARTEWYFSDDHGIIPRVAKRMGMVFVKENMRIDGELFPENGFPQIFIESENVATTIADRELENLCYVRAPLKVVITVCAWPDEALLKRWLGDIRDCQDKWLPESPEVVYGFIIGDSFSENTESGKWIWLKFHLLAVSPNGEILAARSEVVGDYPEFPSVSTAAG